MKDRDTRNRYPVNPASYLALAALMLFASGANAAGIIESIVKAPVVADGDVTGKPTDYVINLSGSMDPNVAGRSLHAGDKIRVIFPPEFDLANLNPAYPLLDAPTPLPPIAPLTANDCVPGWLTCTTAEPKRKKRWSTGWLSLPPAAGRGRRVPTCTARTRGS